MTEDEFKALPTDVRERIAEIERLVHKLVIDIGLPRTRDLMDSVAASVRSMRIVP